MKAREGLGVRPDATWWRAARIAAQLVIPIAIISSPLLGGWQRTGRNDMAGWDGHGWDLPAGLLQYLPESRARDAYDAIVVSGGGTAVDYFGIAIVDPLVGTMALLGGVEFATRTLVAWALAVAIALVAGRVFCGWFCPFGTLARALESLIERLPVQPPRYRPPRRRFLRFVILAAGLVLGAIGMPMALYVTLPHLLVQQTGYAMWLMGGAGAAFGGLVGLAGVGFVFGPTLYCTTVCPTGAALGLLGRRRLVRLTIVEPEACGPHCDLCDSACWLSLQPSRGDPGPDCDSCGRCASVCPHSNLSVNVRAKIRRRVLASALLWVAIPASAFASGEPNDPRRPDLRLESTRVVGDVDVSISVVDLRGIELDANDGRQLVRQEVTVYLARGEPEPVDRIGRQQPREIYAGPIAVDVVGDEGTEHLWLDAPNYPTSTPHRTMYRMPLRSAAEPGDRVILQPIPGWVSQSVAWRIPDLRAAGLWRTAGYGLGAAFLFAGLLSVALGFQPGRPSTRGRVKTGQ